jgi:speckle-type POZ protein
MAAAEASAAALASSVGRLAASKHVSEHEQTWRLEGLTLASFTGAAVGALLHSPPFQACGLAWRLSLAPSGSKAVYKDHVGVCCELLSPDATARTTQAVTFAVGGSELGTFGASGGSVFSTCAVCPEGAVPYWGPGLTLSHAELAAHVEKHLPGGVLTVRAVLRFDASEERTNPIPPSLGVDLGALLESGEHTDVTLVCGGERLAAHALVLRARSPVFAAQLADGPLRADADAVPVPPEITPHTLRRLLHFLYTDELEIASPEEATHLLNAADQYDVPRLFALCERTLSDALSVDNAAATLTLADQHSALALKNAALRFVAANTLAVMATAGWAQLLAARPLLMTDVMHTMAAGEPPAPRAVAAQAGTSAL